MMASERTTAPEHGTDAASSEVAATQALPVVNLLRGWPAPSLLPAAIIKSAAHAALSDPAVAFAGLEYGPDPGYEPCREAIANWLTASHHSLTARDSDGESFTIGPERICITGGASQNLACMLAVYTDPTYTRNVWIVEPAYMLAFRIFEDAGFGTKLRAIPDHGGIDLEYLRQKLIESEADAATKSTDKPLLKPGRPWAKVYKHVIYCVPSFSNPSGTTMSLDAREGLVRLAREFDVLVIPDDVYDFLHWPVHKPGNIEAQTPRTQPTGVRLPRLIDIDRSLDGGAERPDTDGFGNVCSNGSFSKIVGPGIRVGWVEGTKRFAHGIAETGSTKSGGAPSQLTSTYMTHIIRSGELQHHIDTTLLPAYAHRHHTMVNAVEEHLVPLGFQMHRPNDFFGGYFIWLALPTSLHDLDLVGECLRRANTIVASGKVFQVPGDSRQQFNNHIRLCFAFEDVSRLIEGIRRISQVSIVLLERRGDCGGNSQDSKAQQEISLDGLQ